MASDARQADGRKDIEAIQALAEARATIRGEMRKVIVGQDRVIEELLIAILAAGTASSSACRGSRRR